MYYTEVKHLQFHRIKKKARFNDFLTFKMQILHECKYNSHKSIKQRIICQHSCCYRSLFLNLFGSLRYCLGFLLLIHSFSLFLYSNQSKKEVRNRHKELKDILQATCRQVIWL